MKIASVRNSIRRHGILEYSRIKLRKVFPPRARCTKELASLIVGQSGLEIGGPSYDFGPRGLLPIYPIVRSVDNVNFGVSTVWEGSIKAGQTFRFSNERDPGYQYIAEASDLAEIKTGIYDFVLSSHTLEHSANPIRALSEWLRVLKYNGLLILILPHKAGTFDHRRPTTTLEHMKADFDNGTDEHDLTHLSETLELHDLAQTPEAGDLAAFEARSRKNYENRCLHHHTFTTRSAIELVDYMGMQILSAEVRRPFHIMVIARKTSAADNSQFLAQRAEHFLRSPFKSDRCA